MFFQELQTKSQVYTIPRAFRDMLVRELRDGELAGDCGNRKEAPLFSENYVELNDGALLIFVGLPDYLCGNTNSFIPLTFALDGRWAWGARLPGAPTLLVRAPGRQYWLVTQWQVEGTFPTLYRSSDCRTWTEVPLPEERDVECCFELLTEVCVGDTNIRLRFEGGSSGTVRYWEATLRDIARARQPAWKSVEAQAAMKKPCTGSLPGQGTWIRHAGASGILFQSARLSATVLFPERIDLSAP